jgi:hypothetical protein
LEKDTEGFEDLVDRGRLRGQIGSHLKKKGRGKRVPISLFVHQISIKKAEAISGRPCCIPHGFSIGEKFIEPGR